MNYNDDYLAKKIADEQYRTYAEAFERRRIRCWKIALIGTSILMTIFVLLFTSIITIFLPMFIIPYILLLAITIRYCKKHPKNKL